MYMPCKGLARVRRSILGYDIGALTWHIVFSVLRFERMMLDAT